MRRQLQFLRDYKKESIIGPLFKMLEACFELIVPLVMANIIDIGIGSQDKSYIMTMGGVLVLLGIVGLVCSLTAQYFAAKAAMGFGSALRNALYAHISCFSYEELDKVGMPTLITRMTSDVNQVQTGVNIVLRLFLRSPFLVVGAVIMAFTIHVKMGILFLLSVPVIGAVVFGIIHVTIPLYKKAQGTLDQIARSTRENLIGVRVIRAFRGQQKERKAFRETNESLYDTQVHVGAISSLMNPLTYILVNLAIILIIYIGGMEVDKGILTTGEVYALVNYMTQILLALIAMANLITSITKATASSIRLNEVFDTEPGMSEGEHDFSEMSAEDGPKVQFDHVSFAYGGSEEEALSDVTFEARAGQTIGIIGGTGAGKSTLVNLLPRFYDATKGSVKINGCDVGEYTYSSLREMIGVVPQKAVLFRGTIRDNMKWGKKDATDEEIMEALRIAQAEEFVMAKPDGLDEMIAAGGKNLSGGQRQRLTIARAIVAKPEILILDDSGSALDYATDAALRKAIRSLPFDMTVFIVSQRAASIMHADQIVVLEDGKTVGIGTHEQLLEHCETYQEICMSQLSKEEVRNHA